jgi:hypothetical protein
VGVEENASWLAGLLFCCCFFGCLPIPSIHPFHPEYTYTHILSLFFFFFLLLFYIFGISFFSSSVLNSFRPTILFETGQVLANATAPAAGRDIERRRTGLDRTDLFLLTLPCPYPSAGLTGKRRGCWDSNHVRHGRQSNWATSLVVEGEHESFFSPPTKSARLELYRRVMMTMINVVTRD